VFGCRGGRVQQVPRSQETASNLTGTRSCAHGQARQGQQLPGLVAGHGSALCAVHCAGCLLPTPQYAPHHPGATPQRVRRPRPTRAHPPEGICTGLRMKGGVAECVWRGGCALGRRAVQGGGGGTSALAEGAVWGGCQA